MPVPDALDVSTAGVRALLAKRPPSSWQAALGRLAALIAGAVCLVGCGEEDAKKQAAYNEAVRALEQDRTNLKNLQIEAQRLQGEYDLSNYEGWLWGGNFQPRLLFGFTEGQDSFGNATSLVAYLYRKLPMPWPLQLERLLTERSELLPWTNRTRGELYRRRSYDYYSRKLKDVNDRLALQIKRVQHAEEYVHLLTPAEQE